MVTTSGFICGPRSARAMLMAMVMLTALAVPALADVSFDASVDKTTVTLGRHAVLTLTLSADTSSLPDVPAPTIEGADVSGGGTSQSYQMSGSAVNVTKSWTWLVIPRSVGIIDIPPFEVAVEGVVHRTRALELEVVASASSPAGGPAGNSDRSSSGADSPAPDQPGPGDDRFVTLALDKDHAHVGEQLILVFRYYESVGARGFDRPEYTPARTEGFWRENLGETETYRERRNGVLYQVSRINYSLVPTRPGELVIEPARVILPRDVFSDFFGGARRGRTGPQELWTNSLSVRVDDLPSPPPDDFSGLVSRSVHLRASLDRETVPRGEAVSVTVELVGDGSLKSIELPAWDLPDAFTVHDAGGTTEQRPVSGRLRGAVRQERILQPREEGVWTLPPISFSYFDTEQDAYRTVASAPLELTVTPSDLPVTGDQDGGGRRRSLERLGDDLVFVKAPTDLATGGTAPLVERGVWWLIVLAPLVLLAIWRGVLARQDAALRDPVGRRRRLALTTAHATLDAATKSRGPAECTAMIQKAVLGYVADRMGTTRAAVGRGDLLDLAAAAGADEAGATLARILEVCELARFGSGAGEVESTEDLVQQARQALKTLSGRDGRVTAIRSGAAAWLVPLAMGAALVTGDDALSAPDPARLVAEGIQAYTAGDLELARDLFGEADAWTADPVVAYDLGTTCARQGDLGSAVLHFERALRDLPRDADIDANLERVRERLADSEQADGTPALVGFLVDQAGKLTIDEWALLVAVLAWIVAGGVAHAWWRGFLAPWHRRVLVGGVVTLLLTAAVLSGRWHDERRVVHAVVIDADIDVRSGPEASFPVLFEAHAGLMLRIEDERDDWSQVTLGGDWRGWVPASSIAAVDRDHQNARSRSE